MAYKRQKRLICLFLAVITLWFGVCFEFDHADSSFVCASQASDSPLFYSIERPSHEISCMSEMLEQYKAILADGQQDEAGYKRSSINQKNNLDRSLKLSEAAISIYYGALQEIRGKVRSNAIIVNFIHKKDGKKAQYEWKKSAYASA
jgi:hypothetical protein